MTLAHHLRTAERITQAAGALLATHFDHLQRRQIHHAARHEYVTDLDRRVNRLISQRLKRAFPDDGIVSEEARPVVGHSGYTWHIDPLDGTSNYVSHVPYWAVSLALVVNGAPILGVVSAPLTRERFSALAGRGAWRNGRRIRVSAVASLRRAFVSFDHHQKTFNATALRREQRLADACWHTRVVSSAALDLVSVAAGHLDATVMPGPVRSWDVLASALIAREAGAWISELTSQPFTLDSRDLLATTPALRRPLMKLLHA